MTHKSNFFILRRHLSVVCEESDLIWTHYLVNLYHPFLWCLLASCAPLDAISTPSVAAHHDHFHHLLELFYCMVFHRYLYQWSCIYPVAYRRQETFNLSLVKFLSTTTIDGQLYSRWESPIKTDALGLNTYLGLANYSSLRINRG